VSRTQSHTFRDRNRNSAIFLADIILATASFPISLYLRLSQDVFLAQLPLVTFSTMVFAGVATLVIWRSKLHRIAWRYVSVDDALLLGRTAVFINLGFLAAMFLSSRLDGVPRSSVIIDTMVLTTLFVGARLVVRLWHEKQLGLMRSTSADSSTQAVLLVGATDEAEAFIRKVARDPIARFRVIGIIDPGGRPIGSRIRGVKILGSIDELGNVLTAYRNILTSIIIADPSLRGDAVRDMLEIARQHNIRLDRLPEMTRLTKASAKEIDVRPVDVEDLLSRPQAELDREGMGKLIHGKRVLITGAGGSIGSELVRQIAGFDPSHVTLFDNSEFNLYDIDHQLGELFPDLPRTACIGNVREADHVERIFSRAEPELVFHAAALKHVPMLQSQPSQAILTNVMGTRNIADAAVRHNVNTMVMISTDKAAHPVNIMGASKRIAETYCQSLDIESRRNSGTQFVTVRFGNVLGSAGSVVPLFQKQLQRGGPVTVTHEEMTRYFMTIREAVELVLQAATLQDQTVNAGGAIVVLDMGEPVKIIDMATEMIKLAGFTPGHDMQIEITGLRPGERLYEDLFDDAEELLPTSHSELMAARPRVADRAFVDKGVEALIEAAQNGEDEKVRDLMERVIPDFKSIDAVETAPVAAEPDPHATE
jgi:FlaA1/EpsC-like NDP-sugar epimerase